MGLVFDFAMRTKGLPLFVTMVFSKTALYKTSSFLRVDGIGRRSSYPLRMVPGRLGERGEEKRGRGGFRDFRRTEGEVRLWNCGFEKRQVWLDEGEYDSFLEIKVLLYVLLQVEVVEVVEGEGGIFIGTDATPPRRFLGL